MPFAISASKFSPFSPEIHSRYPQNMAFLEVNQVTKAYETNGSTVSALRGVSLSAEPGEWIALTGRSGCGKSTLLNLCGAMDFPSSGTVSIGGEITSRLNDRSLTRLRRERIGFVFQSFQLLHTLSVIENVEAPLLLAGKSGQRAAAEEKLHWVEMGSFLHRLPHQLSGGQQQRVAIARALVSNPRLILADEPTGNLDTATGEVILQLLRRVSTELGTVVLMATHSLESASLADRTIRMRDGLIVTEHE
jgi:ABC-type lipoprotein export system ATPase subunit